MTAPRPLLAAGLTNPELALLYGVSRQTIWGWVKGRAPRGAAARSALAVTKALESAMDRSLLPLAATSGEERQARIKSMVKILREMKPVPIK